MGEDQSTSVNDQIVDSLEEIRAAVQGSDDNLRAAITQQVFAQAVGMAMQDAVAQQQRVNTIRNAITAAASRTVLNANAETLEFASKAAEAAITIAEAVPNPDVVETLGRLQNLISKNAAPPAE